MYVMPKIYNKNRKKGRVTMAEKERMTPSKSLHRKKRKSSETIHKHSHNNSNYAKASQKMVAPSILGVDIPICMFVYNKTSMERYKCLKSDREFFRSDSSRSFESTGV